jgi:hypothetical protein
MGYKKTKAYTKANKKTKLRRRKKNKTRKIKQFRGGFVNPFYELGTAVSTLGDVLSNQMTSLIIPPTPTNLTTNIDPNPTVHYTNGPIVRPVAEIFNTTK